MRYLNILLIAALLFTANCGGGGSSKKKDTTQEKIEAFLLDAWIFFEQTEYDSAEYYFDQALALDNEFAESNLGKAWSKLMAGDSDFDEIESALTTALADTAIKTDGLAGLAVITNLEKKYSTSADYVDQLLALASAYVFQYKTDINYQDMLVIQAHSYFYNKQFDEAYESILKLTNEYAFDPDDSSTWVVDGDTYPSYEGAISAALSKVADLYKSF